MINFDYADRTCLCWLYKVSGEILGRKNYFKFKNFLFLGDCFFYEEWLWNHRKRYNEMTNTSFKFELLFNKLLPVSRFSTWKCVWFLNLNWADQPSDSRLSMCRRVAWNSGLSGIWSLYYCFLSAVVGFIHILNSTGYLAL